MGVGRGVNVTAGGGNDRPAVLLPGLRPSLPRVTPPRTFTVCADIDYISATARVS